MSMSSSNELIVFYLENSKWLLHFTQKNNSTDDELFEEARVKYEFVSMNNIICVYERIPIDDTLMIDYHVKRYMRYHGIENVRGGTYNQLFFTSKIVDKLTNEIFYDYHKEIEENARIQSLIKVISTKPIPERKNVYNSITHKINMLKKAEHMIENVKYAYKDTDRETIDRETCSIIEDLIHRIDYGSYSLADLEKHHLNEFERVINLFPYIYENFNKLEQHTKLTMNPELLTLNATKLLEPLYKGENHLLFDKEYLDMALKILNHYKYMVNCIINRSDEYEFDIEYYGKLLSSDDYYTIRHLENTMQN